MRFGFTIRRFRARGLRAAATTVALLAVVWPGAAPSATASTQAAPPAITLAPAAPLHPGAHAARAPQALSPSVIHGVYALPARGARGQTIAVVSAFDDPHLQADLSAYDRRFGLPPCTFQNKCLRKLNESGKPSPLPGTDATGGTWITESALGTEIAHGVCQSCSVLLVEASDEL